MSGSEAVWIAVARAVAGVAAVAQCWGKLSIVRSCGTPQPSDIGRRVGARRRVAIEFARPPAPAPRTSHLRPAHIALRAFRLRRPRCARTL